MPDDFPEPSDRARDDGLTSVRFIARLLDSAVGVPGTGIRVGLDPLLGLVPGLGDVAGAALSGYIVLAAARRGAPASVVVRMLGNIAVDTAVGAVPLLGDLFDAGWKSNTRNVALLERHVGVPSEARASSRLVVAATFAVLVVLAAAGLWCTYLVLHALGALLTRPAE
jgi:Domain of unknown function (DUF4112)